MGNRIHEQIKNGSTVLRNVNYTYNEQKEMIRWHDTISGANLNHLFNGSGQLMKVFTDSDKPQFNTYKEYEYTHAGKIKQIKDANGQVTDAYTYYENGLMKTSAKDGITYSYQYNARGDVTRMDWVQDNKPHFAKWEYDNRGNVVSYKTYMQVVESRTKLYVYYDKNNKPKEVSYQKIPHFSSFLREEEIEKVVKHDILLTKQTKQYIIGTNLTSRTDNWKGKYLEAVHDSHPYIKFVTTEDDDGSSITVPVIDYDKVSSRSLFPDEYPVSSNKNLIPATLDTTYTNYNLTGDVQHTQMVSQKSIVLSYSIKDDDGDRTGFGKAIMDQMSTESNIWTDTLYSRGGLRLQEKLDGADTSDAYFKITRTYFNYDGNGKVREFVKDTGNDDKRPEQRTFIYNNDGQVLNRKVFDKDQSSGNYNTEFHYANGNAVGRTGQNEKGTAENQLGTGDFSLVKHIGESFPSGAISSFTATGGETLRQIASSLMGNGNLWFVLAEANGLKADDTLKAGQTITIPSSVATAQLDADSHKVYNESEILGNTMPNVRQEAKKKKCANLLAIIIVVAVAIVATALTVGAGAWIAGALGEGLLAGAGTVVLSTVAGAAIYAGLNIAQQYIMIGLGLQKEFSWDQVGDQAQQGLFAGALAGLGAYAQLDGVTSGTKQFINISKTTLKVASKAYQQVKNNDGKINNWSGLLLAAAPLAGDVGFTETADVVSRYSDYASPWLGLAEKAIRNDQPITRDDYLMAIGNTIGTASDAAINSGSPSSVVGAFKRAGIKSAIAGAMYGTSKSASRNYFAQSIGQEVGGLASAGVGALLPNIQRDPNAPPKPWERGRQIGLSGVSQAVSTYTTNRLNRMSDNDALVSTRMGLQSGLNDTTIDNLAANRAKAPTANVIGQAVDAIGEMFSNDEPNTQRYDFGKIDNIDIIDDFKDGEHSVYGAFDKKTGKILITRGLMERAQNGDEKARAHLLGLVKEEQTHRLSRIEEQKLNIEDFDFDEGALAARNLLKALGKHEGPTVFSFATGDDEYSFQTSQDAINSVMNEKFGWGRILADRQSGDWEFDAAGDPVEVRKKILAHIAMMTKQARAKIAHSNAAIKDTNMLERLMIGFGGAASGLWEGVKFVGGALSDGISALSKTTGDLISGDVTFDDLYDDLAEGSQELFNDAKELKETASSLTQLIMEDKEIQDALIGMVSDSVDDISGEQVTMMVGAVVFEGLAAIVTGGGSVANKARQGGQGAAKLVRLLADMSDALKSTAGKSKVAFKGMADDAFLKIDIAKQMGLDKLKGLRSGLVPNSKYTHSAPYSGYPLDDDFVGAPIDVQAKLPRVRFTEEVNRLLGDAPEGMINPHRHHILEVNGRAGEHRSLVREGQIILKSYDIDPLQGVENLIWAPNKGHTKAAAADLVEDLRSARELDLGRDEIIEILNDHGQRAAGR